MHFPEQQTLDALYALVEIIDACNIVDEAIEEKYVAIDRGSINDKNIEQIVELLKKRQYLGDTQYQDNYCNSCCTGT